MSELEKNKNRNRTLRIDKMGLIKAIERRNDEIKQLKSQLQQKENIIKEVREYAIWQKENPTYDNIWREYEVNKLLEILDSENKGE